MTKNRLKIDTEALALDLCGDAEYVEDAYEAIRSVILDRFELMLSQERAARSKDEDVTQSMRITQRLFQKPEEAKVQQDQAGFNHLHLVVCGAIYHNVSLVDRESFERSIFGRALHGEHLERVFINAEDQEQVGQDIVTGKVLWRELTAAGKAAIRGEG